VGRVGRWADRAREVTSKRVQLEGETQTLRRFHHWQGGFEQRYKIGAGRVESRKKEKLGQKEFWTSCHCDGRNCQDLEVCENQSLRFYIILETKGRVRRRHPSGHI
jgi:hypothetical protein